MWMARYDRLLTSYTKSITGLEHAICTYCGNIEEILHALRDCPILMRLWLHIVSMQLRDKFFHGGLL